MKELSIEQKAKRYDESIERMKDFLKEWENYGAVGEAMEKARNVFPELKESEDEKIRKEMISYMKHPHSDELFPKAWIAYLEKQGEQKPVFEMKTPEESLGIDPDTYNKIVDECIYGKQKPAWSEEDKNVWLDIKSLIDSLLSDGGNSDYTTHELQKMWDWLDTIWQKDRVQPQPKQEWSEDLGGYINELSKQFPEVSFAKLSRIAIRVAKWQKEQIEEILLSEVLPCFMHGGEADEVVAKLDEVLNQKK